MKAPVVAAYRFGPFELRVDDHVLLRDGERVSLSPKAVDLLELLVAELDDMEPLPAEEPQSFTNTVEDIGSDEDSGL